jgi:hypothetical protein
MVKMSAPLCKRIGGFLFFLSFFFFSVLGFELRASNLQSKLAA